MREREFSRGGEVERNVVKGGRGKWKEKRKRERRTERK